MNLKFNQKQNVSFFLLFSIVLMLHCSDIMPWIFNKGASDPDNKPDEVIKTINIKPGNHVADLGAGGGYYTLRFANEVGKEGIVYAVDINQDYLDLIITNAKKEGIENVKPVLADEDNSLLPEKSIDLVFVRNVFHHLPDNDIDYFIKLQKVIKPNGRVVIIDPKCSNFLNTIIGHCTSEEDVIKKIEKAGYSKSESYDFLPKQSMIIFSLKK